MVRIIKAPAILSFIWPLVLVIGGYAAWHRWGYDRVGQYLYSLDRQTITITPPPEHVRTDVVAEVFKTHQLERTNLLNRMATAVIAEAFKTHPWVGEVTRVEKMGGGVNVQVVYRRPVAMVRVKSKHPEIQGDGLFFIDGEGILLPTSDFNDADKDHYLQIIVPDSYPAGVGAPYGDDRVMAAAKIARLLSDERDSLNLFAIELTNPRRTFDESWIFAIVRNNGDRFVWGSPPGEEVASEPNVEQKLKLLRSQPAFQGDLRLAKLPR